MRKDLTKNFQIHLVKELFSVRRKNCSTWVDKVGMMMTHDGNRFFPPPKQLIFLKEMLIKRG